MITHLHLIMSRWRRFHQLLHMDQKTPQWLRMNLKYVSLGLSSGVKQLKSICLWFYGTLRQWLVNEMLYIIFFSVYRNNLFSCSESFCGWIIFCSWSIFLSLYIEYFWLYVSLVLVLRLIFFLPLKGEGCISYLFCGNNFFCFLFSSKGETGLHSC